MSTLLDWDYSTTWMTNDGRILLFTDMTDDHLLNTERFMRGRGSWELPKGGKARWQEENWRVAYRAICDEVDRRKLLPLSADHEDAIERHYLAQRFRDV